MKCKNCNWTIPDNARFCSNCGQPLTSVSVPTQGTTGGFSLDRYLPRELAAKFEAMRASKSMSGERRIITMLFCDVKGSTAAAEQLDPEEWTEIINGAFEQMIRPIYKYEGLVPRLMGDAILAFFGAPIAHEDDPQRAVLAGLEIQSGIKPYAEEMHARYGVSFGLRVGINTGLVVVGEIGSDLRMEYTAIGDAINLAARMEQTAAHGSVQISEETYKLVAPFFEFDALGGIEVKGKSAPVNAYRVRSVKEIPGQLRGLKGLSSPLIGREAESLILEEALGVLQKGQGGAITILGEAGLGKSTLVASARYHLKSSAASWLEAHALSYARSISYFSWRQIIRQLIGARESDTPSEVRGKLRSSCNCCALPGGDIPFLEAILAVESQESLHEVIGFQGDALLHRITDATRGYLCSAAGETPLVITFDDLHWMDEASLTLLSSVLDLAENNPVLFICMMRPEQNSPSWEFNQRVKRDLSTCSRQIELSPFSSETMNTLLVNLLGPDVLPKSIRDSILEKAGGNPFFVEEIIRSLIETGQIIREEDGWRPAEKITKISLPSTLSGVLGARIDRLPEATRHILQNAAVIGRLFDLHVLKRLTHLNGALDPHIQYLKEVNLIEPARDAYSFRHVLIQEAAYDSILLKKRAELHRQIGEILEELHMDRIEEFAPVLAYHFYAAQDPRSLKYDLLAGEEAARLYANAEAVIHFSPALETAKRLGVSPEQIEDLYKKLGQSLELSGRYDEALETYNNMEAYAREHAVSSMQLAALLARATVYSTFTSIHNSALAEKMLIQALALAHQIGDNTTEAKLNWNLMLTFLFSKRIPQAAEYGEQALAAARQGQDREQLAFILNDISRVYTCLGQFQKAIDVVLEARGLWQTLGNQAMLADNFGAEAEARHAAGEYEMMIDVLHEALAINERIENIWGQSYARILLSFAHYDRGEANLAIQMATEGIRLGDESGLLASSIGVRCDLAWMYGNFGAIEKGLELTKEALQIAREKHSDWVPLPTAILVRLAVLKGNLAMAESIAETNLLKPISIPYPHYTILLSMANVELALARKSYRQALDLVNELLAQVYALTRPGISELLQTKAKALIGIGKVDQAYQVLVQARSYAEALGAKQSLWPILALLAEIEAQRGNQVEARALNIEAKQIVSEIAERLDNGLRDSFTDQPQVQALQR